MINEGKEVRNSILNAMSTFIDGNKKDYPYDKTYIGRIQTVNTDGTYDILINGKIYQSIIGTPLFTFKVNDLVFCIAIQNNTNLLRAILCLGDTNSINVNNLSSNNITSQQGTINTLKSTTIASTTGTFTNGIFSNLTLNGDNVDSIVSSSFTTNGYVQYSSGLIIQWGNIDTPSSTGTVTFNFPIIFNNNCFGLYANVNSTSSSGSGVDVCYTHIVSTSQGSITHDYATTTNSINHYWYAIGY